MRTPTSLVAFAVATMVAVAGCGTSTTMANPSPTAAPATAAPAASSAAPASASPAASASACTGVATVAAGTLTIGTDNPAYPPYFDDSTKTKPWELGDPTNGKGFESAVAYAVAERMGFAKDAVSWIAVPFDNSFKPGAKPFDLYLAQVSDKPERAQAADLSDGYYDVAQAVVALKGSAAASAKSIADLKGLKLGAMVGTTSYDTITGAIAPTAKPMVYSTNDDAVTALKAKQIDGLVVDLPTAFYVTAVQVEDGVIVGQLPARAGENAEHFSLVLAKGSPLTACANEALASLKADGTLAGITQEWMADKANAPVLQP